jgi:hypothetical protein
MTQRRTGARTTNSITQPASAPEWITQGVTVLERERELKRSGKDTPTVAKDPGAAN